MGIARTETKLGLVGVGAHPDLPTDAELVNAIVRSTRVLRKVSEGKGALTPACIKAVRIAQELLSDTNRVIETFGYDSDMLFTKASEKVEKSALGTK